MNKIKVGYTRPSLIEDLTYDLLFQEKILKDAGCNAFINDPNFKLDYRKNATQRLFELGFWDICDQSGPGTILMTTDASRLLRNYTEIPELLNTLTIHEAQLVIFKDNFSQKQFLQFVLRMNKVAETTRTECIKVGQRIYSTRGGRYGPVITRSLALSHAIAMDLITGVLVSDAAIFHDVSAAWIYAKALNSKEIQEFYKNLTKAEVASNSIDLHNKVNALVLIAKKSKRSPKKPELKLVLNT